MTENGRGEERKINGEPATPVLVADREGRLKLNLRKMNLYFIHGTSQCTAA
jgi:hypothetical protein